MALPPPAASSEGSSPHVVVLPFAQQGHINPLMQLSKKLASHGCIVTFVLSENIVPAKPSSSPNIRYAGVSDLLPPERSRGSNMADSVESMTNMEKGFESLLHRLHVLKEHPVSYIIADAFMLWSQRAASKFSIPCICFFTTLATGGALIINVPDLIRDSVMPFPRDENGRIINDTAMDGFPGVPPLRPSEFPMCLTFDATDFRFRFVAEMCRLCKEAPALIMNTFEELEGEALAALRQDRAVYALGPLLLMAGSPTRLDVNYWVEEDHCLAWLDGRAPSSVVYVSLGSVATLPAAHFREFAAGLEASGQPFLWVVRPNAVQEGSWAEALPDGFSERTRDRGLIISWGPQLLILGHPAVGAFLTHGGWNSIIENLSTGGVPMICWPHIAEQRLNRLLVSEKWKMGLPLGHQGDAMVSSSQVEQAVRRIMQGHEAHEFRVAAGAARDLAKRAVNAGGSSHRSFEALVDALRS